LGGFYETRAGFQLRQNFIRKTFFKSPRKIGLRCLTRAEIMAKINLTLTSRFRVNVDEKMQIGKLAQLAQVTPRTIRYYESLGLLHPSEREGSGFRYYSSDALMRLKKIEYLKKLDFSLDEIASVIELYFSGTSNYQGKLKIIEILQAHLKETDEKIVSLQQFRSEIKTQIENLQKSFEDILNN